MKKILTAIVAAGVAFSTAHTKDMTDQSEYPLYYKVSLMGGLAKPDDASGLDDGANLGMRIEIPRSSFDTHLVDSLQFALDYHDLDTETSTNDFSRQSVKASVNGLLYMFDESTVNPFLLVGLGADRSKFDNNAADTESFFNAGVGTNINFTKDVAFVLEAKNIYVDGNTQTLANAGISIGFGGKAAQKPVKQDSDNDGVVDEKDQCKDTREGAAVDIHGCLLDSDDDGVPNIHDRCPATPKEAAVNKKGCMLDSDHDGVADAADKCPNTILGMEVDIRGCPRYFDFNIHFDLDEATIKEKYDTQIKKFADYLKRVPEYEVELIGYADESGETAYNQTLSEKRALAVKQQLIQNGVEENRIITAGAGEKFPLQESGDEISEMNRRVRALLHTR